MTIRSKQERLVEFFLRLGNAPAVSTFDAAYSLLCATLDAVEDELSGQPNDPARWMTLDRMFPPQMDRMSRVAGCDVKRFDSLRHITYIGGNGAIEIRTRRKSAAGELVVHFSKSGADGRLIGDICPHLEERTLRNHPAPERLQHYFSSRGYRGANSVRDNWLPLEFDAPLGAYLHFHFIPSSVDGGTLEAVAVPAEWLGYSDKRLQCLRSGFVASAFRRRLTAASSNVSI